MAAVIETRGLTKRYGAQRGIDDVSLSVDPGEVFGLLGSNGAGKTTLVRTLLGLLRPTSGAASIFGLDCRTDAVAVHERLGNLAGSFACDPRLTGRALLRFCAAVRGMDGLGVADALAERFDAHLDRPVGELSRGSRQKVGIIQAAFHEPELLVLDEPTDGLDPLMQAEFLALLREHRARGGTALISSHDLPEVQAVCDRVAIVRDGSLVTVETVAALRGAALHHVRVRFADGGDTAWVTALPGVRDVRDADGELHFDVGGPLDPVVKALAERTVADLEITIPSLEETFLAFYEGRS